jgi:hypothetical protein
MRFSSFIRAVPVLASILVPSSALANGSHHGGGGGSSDGEGECLRWETVYDDAGLDASDAADGADAEATDGASEAAPPPSGHLVCAERAGLVPCSVGPTRGDASGAALFVAPFAIAVVVRRAARSRRGTAA